MQIKNRDQEINSNSKGSIPEKWEIRKLKDLALDLIGGGTPSTVNPDYWNGNIAWMTSAHITGREVINGQRHISNTGLENSAAQIVPKNNLLVATRVGIGKIAINRIDVAISQDLTGVIIDKNKAVPDFLYWVLLKDERKLKSLAQGSTIKGILREDLGKIALILPPLREQSKIAEILSTVDHAIEKVEEAIEKTQRLKKGLMQELLTKGIGHKEFGHTEIGMIPSGWKVKRIREIVSLCQYGLSIKMTKGGNYPIIKMDDIENGYVVPKKFNYVSVNNETYKKFGLLKGDILFNRTNSYELVGRTGIFLLDGEFVFASYLIRIRAKAEIADPLFLTFYLIFSGDRLRNFATRAVHQANINAASLLRYKVAIPPLDEQKEIVRILVLFNKRLDTLRNKKENLERVKKGLMEDLLTGRRRVKLEA